MADSHVTTPPEAPPLPAAGNPPAPDTTTTETPRESPRESPRETPRETPRERLVVERRSGFLARWLKRLLALVIFLAILLVLAFVGITLVLRSNVPRSLGESIASEMLGLEVGLGEVNVGWSGDVTIRDLLLRLPSAEGEGEKLLEVPRIKAELGALPMVALDYLRGAQPRLKRVEVESPTAYATQSADGWNFVRAATLIGNAGGGQSTDGEQTRSAGLPPLPELALTDGKLIVHKSDGQEATLAGFGLTGSRQNPLVYTIDGGSPQKLEIHGELFPASGKRQEVALKLHGLNEQLRAMFALPAATFDATWQGGLTESGVEGVLEIASATLDETRAEGELKVVTEPGGVVRITPTGDGLTATGVPRVEGEVTIPEGTITIAADVRVDALLVNAMGGQVLVRSAVFDPAITGGSLDVAFKDLKPAKETDLTGQLAMVAGYDAFGEPTARLGLNAFGQMGQTSVQRLVVEVTADGPVYHDWRTLDVLVTLQDTPLLIRPPEEPTTIPEAEARILVRLTDPAQPRVELASLKSLDPSVMDLEASAAFYTAANNDYEAGEYWLRFAERGFPVKLPRVDEKQPADLAVEIKGQYNPSDRTIAPVEITSITGEMADVSLVGSGTYVISQDGVEPDPPLTLSLEITREARIPAPITPAGREIITAQRQLNQPAEGDGPVAGQARPGEPAEANVRQVEPIRGMIKSWLDVTGDPLTVDFKGTGGIMTSEFAVGPFELGTIQSLIELTLTKDYLTVYTPRNKERTNLDQQYAQLFGAHIDFEAVVPFQPEQPGHITLDVQDMHLNRVAEALALPPIYGALNGHLEVDLTGLSPHDATAAGTFTIEEFGVPQMELARRITIRPKLGEGLLSVPVELTQLAMLAPGPTQHAEERTLSLNLSYDLNQPARVQVLNLRADGYPLVLPAVDAEGNYIAAEFSLNAPSILVSFEEATPQVRGHVDARTEVWTGKRPFELETFAQGVLSAEATRARIELEELAAEMPGIGSINGGGTLVLADLPGQSQIFVHGQRLDLKAIAERLDVPVGTEGLVDFSLTVQPGPGERPKGEVLVNFAFAGQEAKWRSVEIDQGQLMVYLSRLDRPDNSPSRGQYDFTLLTTERMRLQLADGVIDGYLKLRNRGRVDDPGRPTLFSPLAGAGDDWYVNATLDGGGLNLAQLAPLAEMEEVEGRAKFSLIAYGNLNQKPAFGQTAEELPLIPLSGEGEFGIVDAELINLNFFQRLLEIVNVFAPTPQRDSLDARFRIEQGNFYLDRMVAYVDGTESHATGRMYDVFDTKQTRIDFTGVIFLKPLSQIPLPFFREADEIFTIIQSSATAFRATGTLKDPQVVPALFTDVGDTLRALLIPSMKRK